VLPLAPGLAALCLASCRRRGRRARPSGRVRRGATDVEYSRKGFRVNTKYKGSKSYGTIGEDELEESARLRERWASGNTEVEAKANERLSSARKRMMQRRLNAGGSAWQRPTSPSLQGGRKPGPNGLLDPGAGGLDSVVDAEMAELAKKEASTTEGAEGDADAEGADDSAGGTVGGRGGAAGFGEDGEDDAGASAGLDDSGAGGRAGGEGASSSGAAGGGGRHAGTRGSVEAVAAFPGLADSSEGRSVDRSRRGAFSELAHAALPLSDAQLLLTNAAGRRRCPGTQLAAAAAALSKAGDHLGAADLLFELRDFGVERDVLERRIDFSEAAGRCEEASLLLGQELQFAGQLRAAWTAILAACAEPQLQDRRRALELLADVSLQLSDRYLNEPSKQVEVLEAALDAELVVKGLSSDRREELEINLALSLQGAGRSEESSRLLGKLVVGSRNQRRRQQAEWAMMVHKVDVSGEVSESARALRELMEANRPPDSLRLGAAGASARAASGSAGRQGLGGLGIPGLQFGGLDWPAALGIALLLALPLAIPLSSMMKGGSG